MQSDNPFSITYDALWQLAERNDVLCKFISRGNRIKYSENLDQKSEISDADLPELALTTNAFVSNLRNSSSTTMMIKNYSWILATGDLSMCHVYDKIMWALYTAMIDYDKYICGLEWNGTSFVKEVRGLPGTEGTQFTEENRMIKGWASIWPIEVEMHFNISEIRQIEYKKEL